MQYSANNLLVRAANTPDAHLLVEVNPQLAGWDTIRFQARRLARAETWQAETVDQELALVVLGGTLSVDSDQGNWPGIGQRENVFAGLPSALYLPPHTRFTVRAETDSEFAVAWADVTAPAVQYPARLVTPADVRVEIRGGDHATRQINSILPPGFACNRLVVVEVYTPGGNWSSYPPHKHDVVKRAPDEALKEADLDEIYYYQFDRPEGYALQRVYTDPESPLQRQGSPIDCVLMPHQHDVVLVPEGYHPVSSPPGYTTYYLNVLVGNAQSLAASDDPQFAWVKTSYQSLDPRVPIYDISASPSARERRSGGKEG